MNKPNFSRDLFTFATALAIILQPALPLLLPMMTSQLRVVAAPATEAGTEDVTDAVDIAPNPDSMPDQLAQMEDTQSDLKPESEPSADEDKPQINQEPEKVEQDTSENDEDDFEHLDDQKQAEVADEKQQSEYIPEWNVDGSMADLQGKLQSDFWYTAPQNDLVRIRFTQLPLDGGELKITEVPAEVLGVERMVGSGYEFKTNMSNGEFKYDLQLPNPTSASQLEVFYSEDGDEYTQVNSGVEVDEGTVTIDGLDHFTVFVIVETLPATVTNGDETDVDCTTVSLGSDNYCYDSIQDAVDAATAGDTINIQNGTYTECIRIDRSGLELVGESRDGVVIDATSCPGYGFTVGNSYTISDIQISNLTLQGPNSNSTNFGFKISDVEQLLLSNVAATGAYRNNIDLHYVNNSVIRDVVASGTTYGTGVAVTDSSNNEFENVTTRNNAWAGMAWYTSGAYYPEGADSNQLSGVFSFNESLGMYTDPDGAVDSLNGLSLDGMVVDNINDGVIFALGHDNTVFAGNTNWQLGSLQEVESYIVHDCADFKTLDAALSGITCQPEDSAGVGVVDYRNIVGANLPPVVTINTPAAGFLTNGDQISVEISATDDYGMGSYYIRLWQDAPYAYNGGTLVGNCQQAPGGDLLGTDRVDTCDFDISGFASGEYFITAQYLDQHTVWGSDQTQVNIDHQDPQITNVRMLVNGVETTLTKPGDTVTVEVTAVDDFSGVDEIDIWIRRFPWDGTSQINFGTLTAMGGDTYQYEFVVPETYTNGNPISEAVDGNYFNFRPTDAAGNNYIGNRQNFTVDATAPMPVSFIDEPSFTRFGDLNSGRIIMQFTESADPDVDYYEYQFRSSNLDGSGSNSSTLNMNTYGSGVTCAAGVCEWRPGFPDGKRNIHRARAVDIAGNKSEWSNWDAVTQADFAAIDPQNFEYADLVAGTGVFALASYNVDDGGFIVRETVQPVSSIVTSGMTTGDPSVEIDYTATDADTGVKQVSLWQSYEGSAWVEVGSQPDATGTFTTTLTSGDGEYCFYTIAEDIADDRVLDNGQGNSEAAKACELQINLDTTAPQPRFWVEENSNQILIEWQNVSDADLYSLYRSDDGYTNPIYKGTNLQHIDDVSVGSSYSYKVTATDQYGNETDLDQVVAQFAQTLDIVIDDNAVAADFGGNGVVSMSGNWAAYGSTLAPYEDLHQNATGGDQYGTSGGASGQTFAWTLPSVTTEGSYEIFVNYMCNSPRPVADYYVYSAANQLGSAAIDQSLLGDQSTSCGSQFDSNTESQWASIGEYWLTAGQPAQVIMVAPGSGNNLVADAVGMNLIEVDQIPQIDVNSTSVIMNVGDNVSINSYITASGNLPHTEYIWDGVCSSATGATVNLANLPAGSYQCSVYLTDADGDQSNTVNVSIEVQEESVTPNLTPNVVLFANSPGTNNAGTINVPANSNFTVTASLAGLGNPNYLYDFSGICSGSVSTGASFATSDTLNLTPGSYVCRVTVTDTDGSQDSASVAIQVQSAAQPNNNPPTGQGGPAVLGAEGVPTDDVDAIETESDDGSDQDSEDGLVLGSTDGCESSEVITVAGIVYVDADEDNTYESGEQGYARVGMDIYTRDDQFVVNTVTDESGEWQESLCPGTYELVVDASSLSADVRLVTERQQFEVDDGMGVVASALLTVGSAPMMPAWFWIFLLIAIMAGLLFFIWSRRRRDNEYELN